MSASARSGANIRERLDELLSPTGPGAEARLQENLVMLRYVLSGNSEMVISPDIARAAVASLEKLAIEGTIEFDEGLNELVQYIRSPADRGARILAAQAVFKLTRAKLNATELVGDVSARSRYQALIAEVVSGVSSDSLLCRPLNQAIDTLKKCAEAPMKAPLRAAPTEPLQTVDATATSVAGATAGPAAEAQPSSIREAIGDATAPVVAGVASSESTEPVPVFNKGGHWGRRDVVLDAACLEATSLENWRIVARRMRKFYSPGRTSPKAIEMHLGVTSQQLRVLMSYCSVYCAPLHFMVESVYKRLHRSIEDISETIAKVKEYEAFLKLTGASGLTKSTDSREISIRPNDNGTEERNSNISNVSSSESVETESSKRPRLEHDDSQSRPPEGESLDQTTDSVAEKRKPRFRFVTRYRIAQQSELRVDGENAELVDELYSGYKDCDIDDMDEDTLQMLHEHGVVVADEVAEEYEASDSEETLQNPEPDSIGKHNQSGKVDEKNERAAASGTSTTPVKDSVPKSESHHHTKREPISNVSRSAGTPTTRQGNNRQGDNRPYAGGAGGRFNAPRGRSDSHDAPYSSDSYSQDFRGQDRFSNDRDRDFGGDRRGGDWDRYDDRRDFDRRDYDRDRDYRGGGGWDDRPPYSDSGHYYDGPEGSRGGGWDRDRGNYGGADKRGRAGPYSSGDSGPVRHGGGYNDSYDGRPNRGGGDSWDNRNYGTHHDQRRGPIHDDYRNDRRDMGPAPARQGGGYSARR